MKNKMKKLNLLNRVITPENQEEFIEDLGREVRSHKVVDIAKKCEMTRGGIYKLFQPNKRPTWISIWKAIDAMGYSFRLKKITKKNREK